MAYLQRYARVLVRLKQFTKALQHWRKLAQGLKKESESWFEAKYQLMLCLAKIDPKSAKAPLSQFMSLYDIPLEWKPRFVDLSKELAVQ